MSATETACQPCGCCDGAQSSCPVCHPEEGDALYEQHERAAGRLSPLEASRVNGDDTYLPAGHKAANAQEARGAWRVYLGAQSGQVCVVCRGQLLDGTSVLAPMRGGPILHERCVRAYVAEHEPQVGGPGLTMSEVAALYPDTMTKAALAMGAEVMRLRSVLVNIAKVCPDLAEGILALVEPGPLNVPQPDKRDQINRERFAALNVGAYIEDHDNRTNYLLNEHDRLMGEVCRAREAVVEIADDRDDAEAERAETVARLSEVATLKAERDEARAWVRRLTSTERILTCVYCGEAYQPGTPDHGADVLTAHIKVCPKHPLRAAEAEIAGFKMALDEAKDIHFARGYEAGGGGVGP